MTSRFAIALILIGTHHAGGVCYDASGPSGDLRVLLVGAALSTIGLLLRRRAARRNNTIERAFLNHKAITGQSGRRTRLIGGPTEVSCHSHGLVGSSSRGKLWGTGGYRSDFPDTITLRLAHFLSRSALTSVEMYSDLARMGFLFQINLVRVVQERWRRSELMAGSPLAMRDY